jgi:hypothetical protein
MDRFVKLTMVEGEAKAKLLVSFLKAEGIQVQLRTHVPLGVYPITVNGLAEVQIWVPAEELEAAQAALAAFYLGGGQASSTAADGREDG